MSQYCNECGQWIECTTLLQHDCPAIKAETDRVLEFIKDGFINKKGPIHGPNTALAQPGKSWGKTELNQISLHLDRIATALERQ